MRTARRIIPGLLLATIALGPGQAVAQVGFDSQQLNPMPSQYTNYYGLASAIPLESGQWELGLFYHYADDPLVLEDADGNRIQSIVDRQNTLNLLGAIGFGWIFDIGFDVPLILTQDGNATGRFGVPSDFADHSFGVGDIRIVPRVQLFTTHTDESPGGVAMAFLINSFIPTGNPDYFQGEGFRIEPRVVLELLHERGTNWSLNVGYMIRDPEEIGDLQVDDTFTYGMAAGLVVNEYLQFVPELAGEISVLADGIQSEEAPLEFLLGLRVFPVEVLMLQLGGGIGVLDGFGTPDFRVFAGLSSSIVPVRDTDRDGIYDDVDECIEQPEDYDGFEDEDGCPDIDNDQDGILDVYDECPMDPEDPDGFEDEDGCPDPDNDQDTILDVDDSCPLDPEDMDGFDDEDGCPDCVENPEDMDGFEDEDGCADPDNDQDTILDVDDECPMVPENFNGVDDEDGCPDSVRVTCEEVIIYDKVYFEYDSDVIEPRSYDLLNQVASTLNALPNLRVVRVEGHTDSRGSNDYNLDLSQRRASSVYRYLTGQGVAAERLVPVGFGEEHPITTNDTRDGRAENRRVQFRILEQEGCEDTPPPPY